MGADEFDIDCPVAVGDCDDQAIVVAFDVEHYPALLADACATDFLGSSCFSAKIVVTYKKYNVITHH